MADNTVRDTKRADELKTGDWLAGMQFDGDGDRPSEVVSVHPYTGGIVPEPGVLLVFRAADGVVRSSDADAGTKFELATDEEIAEATGKPSKRAEAIAQIRELADWLEANPWLPIPNLTSSEHLQGPDELRSVREVRRLAERLGVEVDTRLDDRTLVETRVHGLRYAVIAWHHDGRPAEPASEPGADPTGLSYSREADDPTPVSGARVEMHTGAVTDEGLVDVTKPLISDETIAEVAAMEERDRAAGGPPWEVPEHPENAQPGGWHHGQIR